jgi:glycosyltransferase involved in cell wall biosynthesis
MNTPSNSGVPLVSILIANYNYGRFVAKAIDSALAQTYSNIELIIVDDGSTDNSREVIENYGIRVKAIYQSNSGQSAAFNMAFAASSGELICLLDSDDYFQPHKIERIVECYRQNPAASFVFHPVQRVDVDGKDLATQELESCSRWLDYRRKTNKFAAPPTSGLTFRRAPLARLFPLPEELRILTDNYIKFVLLALYPGYYIAEPLAALRLHGSNAYSMGPSDDLRSAMDVQIANAIRTRFPELLSKADRLISITQAKCWRGLGIGVTVHQGVRTYLKSSTGRSTLRIYAGALGRYCKQSSDAIRQDSLSSRQPKRLHPELLG